MPAPPESDVLHPEGHLALVIPDLSGGGAERVAVVLANEAFVNDVKAKQAQLEDKWVAAAEARGLKNARAVLAEFRAETQKLK